MTIERLWHGWTSPDNADRYERLLRDEIFPEITGKDIAGYRGIRLLRQTLHSGEIEFVTIMSFDSLDAVRAFAGDDYEKAYVPAKARELLGRFDERSRHYEVRMQRGAASSRITSAVPTFLVPEPGTAARWYRDNLGFTIAGTFPDPEPWGYVSLQRDDAELMLLRLEGHRKPDLSILPPERSWDAYLRTDGIHALYATVRGKSFVSRQLERQSYGDWEFEIRDPEGYVLVFGGLH